MNDKSRDNKDVESVNQREGAGKILFIVSSLSCLSVILFYLIMVPWCHSLNTVMRFNVSGTLTWIAFSLGAFTLITAATAFYLNRRNKRRGKEFGLFIFGLLAVAITLPFLPFPSHGIPNIWGYPATNIRSLSSRVHADHRALAASIEQYYLENNTYPAWTLNPDEQVTPFFSNVPMSTFVKNEKLGYRVRFVDKYATALSREPFNKRGRERSCYAYYSDLYGWILLGTGPDEVFDMDFETLSTLYKSTISQPSPELILYSYDGSNGIISSGDIFRVKQ